MYIHLTEYKEMINCKPNYSYEITILETILLWVKKMSSASFKNVINNMFTNHLYLTYVYTGFGIS